jgi:hypothetical protein
VFDPKAVLPCFVVIYTIWSPSSPSSLSLSLSVCWFSQV